MHSKHRILHKIISLFLVAVVFFSTTGFSLLKHICPCNNEITWSFFPDVFGYGKSCCCSENEGTNTIDDLNKINLCNTDCCQNVYLYYKIPTVMIQVIHKVKKFTILFFTFIFTNNIYDNPHQLIISKILSYHSPPLFLFGKSLLRFIHSIKIPLPEL